MNDKTKLARLEKEVMALRRELDEYKRLFKVTPTKMIISKSVQIDGLLHSDRLYTQRSGVYVELVS